MSPPPQFFGYSWDDGQPLSASADESGTVLSERKPHVLLRPVYINAVEVGFAYHQVDRDRRLHVRGVTIALWYFISRGHQAVALLPHCFKVYADKSSNWTELMHLFRLNLIEFTPGFGPDKYVEVNRMLATRARETGGCVVARSQMHAILDELPNLDKTIEKKLLMPAFNGDDLIFPMDGPLGRNGPTLNTTLRCPPSDVEWGRCSHHQMRLSDQRIWVQRLTAIVPNKAAWTLLAGKLADFTPKTPLDMSALPIRPATSLHLKIRPLELLTPEERLQAQERRHYRRSDDPGDSSRGLHQEDGSEYGRDATSPLRYGQRPGSQQRYATEAYSGHHSAVPRYPNQQPGFQRGGCGGGGGYMRRPGMPPSCGPWQPPREYSNAGASPCCRNCHHPGDCGVRAQPVYERRYDQHSDAYYEWRGGTSSHGPFRQVPHNDLLDGSVAPPNNPPGVHARRSQYVSVSPPSQPIADSATERQPLTPNRAKEVFNQVAAILGWEKAKTVTQRFPHVESVQALIEYAFEQPEADVADTSTRIIGSPTVSAGAVSLPSSIPPKPEVQAPPPAQLWPRREPRLGLEQESPLHYRSIDHLARLPLWKDSPHLHGYTAPDPMDYVVPGLRQLLAAHRDAYHDALRRRQNAQNRSARAPAPESPKTNDNLNAATQTPTTTALSKFNEALPIISASTSVSPATNTTTTTMTSEPEVEEEILLIDFSTPVDAPPASSTSSPPPPILTELQDLHF